MKQFLTFLLLATTFPFCSPKEKRDRTLYKSLVVLYEVSKTKAYLTTQVWATAIRYNKYALTTSSQYRAIYVPDHLAALARMETENDIKVYNARIDSLTTLIIRDIGNPKEQESNRDHKIKQLYSSVMAFSLKVQQPSGSLESYSSTLHSLEKTIDGQIAVLKAEYTDQGSGNER